MKNANRIDFINDNKRGQASDPLKDDLKEYTDDRGTSDGQVI